MSLFRSEDMELYEITIPKDHAWEIMNKLGQSGRMHLIDLNREEQAFNLTYCNLVKRCEETERRIAFIEEECKRIGIQMNPPLSPDDFLNSIEFWQKHTNKAVHLFFETIEHEMKVKEQFIQEQTIKAKDMHDNYNLLFEYRIVMKKAMKIIRGSDVDDHNDSQRSFDSNSNQIMSEPHIAVGHIAGTISQSEKLRFKKLIFRATRGNVL